MNLVDRVRRDIPQASEVLVSFPDKWEFLDTVPHERDSIYLAAFPLERAFPRRNHFEGLPPEINVDLVFYRLYKFFQPWPLPQVVVAWNPRQGEGRVIGERGLKLQLQPVGQAQAWYGVSHAVLWEAYIDESRRLRNWQDTLAQVWGVVEKDLDVPKIFTAPQAPTFPEGYREFLTRMGYAQDPEYPVWWSKTRETRTCVTGGASSNTTGALVSGTGSRRSESGLP